MASYKRNYTGIENPVAQDQAAIKDIREYLGDKPYRVLMDMIKEGCSCREIATALSFCGVNGFPIFAFLRTYKPKAEYDAWWNSLPEGE